MIKLRNAGAASILALLLALALLTTGAFAQSTQVSKSASVHTAVAMHNRLGGGPIETMPAPAPAAAPAVAPAAPVVRRVVRNVRVVQNVHATAVAVAHSSDDLGLISGFWGGSGIFAGLPFVSGFGCGNGCF